jgi:hypothetical protein
MHIGVDLSQVKRLIEKEEVHEEVKIEVKTNANDEENK